MYERKLAYKHLETIVSVSPELKLYGRQGELRQALSNLLQTQSMHRECGAKSGFERARRGLEQRR